MRSDCCPEYVTDSENDTLVPPDMQMCKSECGMECTIITSASVTCIKKTLSVLA